MCMKTMTQTQGYKLIGRIHAELNEARTTLRQAEGMSPGEADRVRVGITELEAKLDEITMS